MKNGRRRAVVAETTKLYWKYAGKGWNDHQVCFMNYKTASIGGYKWIVTKLITASSDGDGATVSVSPFQLSNTTPAQKMAASRILRDVSKRMETEGYSGLIEGDLRALPECEALGLEVDIPGSGFARFDKKLRTRGDVGREFRRLTGLDLFKVMRASVASQ